MKRAVLGLLAAMMLIAALPICAFADGLSPEDIILTMTDYRINKPSADTLPFFQNGVLYVPASIFTDLSVTEVVAEGVYVALANMDRILYYNITNDTYSDEDGTEYLIHPLKRGKTWFYPAFEVSEAFGFVCEYYGDIKPVPFFRVARGDTDNIYLNITLQGYADVAVNYAWDYLGVSLDGSDPGTIPTPEEIYRPAVVVNGLDGIEEITAALGKSTGAAVVFCVSAGEAGEKIGACLRATAAGCGFVLRGEGLDAGTLASELRTLNGILRATVCNVCRTVFFFSEPDIEIKQAVADMGCVCTWPDMDFREYVFKDGIVLSRFVTEWLNNAMGRKTVILFDSESAANEFSGLITEFDVHGCEYEILSDVLVR